MSDRDDRTDDRRADPPGADRDPWGDDGDDGDGADDAPGALNVATEGESFLGEEPPDLEPLTPGEVDPENAFFVALGVAFTLFVVATVVL
ncbi:DUF7312 domain-containing protein [Halosegnis marinus]|uniref:DUF7312 domain-containing protein n=1 Tax=Halosegnis marinus TaxID=3034023 RepID=A0ABD5ZQS5_9EURY|nr:hypothetical protein [Halosegnis sp. DT85]